MAVESDTWEEYKKLPRYCVGLQKENDPICYKDFHECNNFTEAKNIADDKALKTGRAVIIFDRKEQSITYKIEATKVIKPIVVEKVVEEPKKKVKAEKKVKRK